MPASDLRVRISKAPEGASGKPKLVGSGGSMVAKLKLKVERKWLMYRFCWLGMLVYKYFICVPGCSNLLGII